MFLHSLKLKNFLSFGSEGTTIELRPLNVIIGANGTGKTNLLEAMQFLCGAQQGNWHINRVDDWLWKGAGNETEKATATVEAIFEGPEGPLRYAMSFQSEEGNLKVSEERIEAENPEGTQDYFYDFNNGDPFISVGYQRRKSSHSKPNLNRSILSRIEYPTGCPELVYLAKNLSEIRIYKDWTFGWQMHLRYMESINSPGNLLSQNSANLYAILGRIREDEAVKQRLLKELKEFYIGFEDFDLVVDGNALQLVFLEKGLSAPVPASRLSDGALRYLSFLAILLNPDLPPLICIDEPELGLHCDALLSLTELIRETSEKCQIIITTHSQMIVDVLSKTPEAVLVCEKTDKGTKLTRLDGEKLKPLLEQYSLGELWSKGEIGGNRW
ncbi:MAG: AAA family ATPase [Clostridiales bacterium]|jgi:predicted ATPase|nr:AAA family ATPase [Clostridiales bacterium]